MARPQRRSKSPSPSRASVVGRLRAGQLAPVDASKALEAARACPDAWYRVQALASVAEYIELSAVVRVLDEAAREAQSCHDAYGQVAVMAWPIRAAFRRGQAAFAERQIKSCLALAGGIEPLASRAYALETLWRCCFEANSGLAARVWERILQLCHPDRSWRAARLYLHVAEASERRNPGDATAVIGAMAPGKTRGWLERRFGLA